jgi:hypothetical protein
MATSREKLEVASGLRKLALDSSHPAGKPTGSKAKKKMADSWEDENLSSDSETDVSAAVENESKSLPSAPPPTPISPTYKSDRPWSAVTDHMSSISPNSAESASSRRPEKTDAVARRMIAGALGIKTPKQTEEQKAYDKAIKEQERKRRNEEKTAEKRRQEDAEKAKAAIWND